MKWLIRAARVHRAVLTAGALMLLDLANGVPLLAAVLDALASVGLGQPL